VLRDGAIPFEKLREVVPDIEPYVMAQPELPGLPDVEEQE
jgi:hypothetical protein